MRKMRTLLALFAAAVAIPATATTLWAQTEPVHCRRAVVELRTDPGNTAAIRSASGCPSSGPTALAVMWIQRAAADDATRAALVEASSSLRDTRVFDAVAGIATARDRPVGDRLAALQVLMRYYNRRYVPSVEDLTSGPPGSPITRRVGGPAPVNGSSPLAETTRGEIGALLSMLASSDGDSTLRGAALRLRQRLAFDDPVNTLLPAASITLVSECGPRVMLRSTADIDVGLQLRVLGTSFARTRAIRAGSVEMPTQLSLELAAGTVVASYGGREVARLTDRNASCPVGATR
jgi:hypothetical protein